MRLTSCSLMREGVIASALFLVFGMLSISLAAWVLPGVAQLAIVANVLGIVSLLLAPTVLIATLLLAVWPGSRRYLADCIH